MEDMCRPTLMLEISRFYYGNVSTISISFIFLVLLPICINNHNNGVNYIVRKYKVITIKKFKTNVFLYFGVYERFLGIYVTFYYLFLILHYRRTLKIIFILIIEILRPVMLCKFLITDIFLTLFTDITQLTKELQIFFAIRPLDNLDRLGKCIYISLHNYKHPIVAKCATP